MPYVAHLQSIILSKPTTCSLSGIYLQCGPTEGHLSDEPNIIYTFERLTVGSPHYMPTHTPPSLKGSYSQGQQWQHPPHQSKVGDTLLCPLQGHCYGVLAAAVNFFFFTNSKRFSLSRSHLISSHSLGYTHHMYKLHIIYPLTPKHFTLSPLLFPSFSHTHASNSPPPPQLPTYSFLLH